MLEYDAGASLICLKIPSGSFEATKGDVEFETWFHIFFIYETFVFFEKDPSLYRV